ncbi:hypothetical protein BH09PLA1_BH09PLA1_28010 [soil metagenome]
MTQQRQRNSRGQFTNRPRAASASRSGRSSTAAMFSLVAGAGVGVAMMYLFDPKAGAQRRRRLAERSASLLESSRELAYDAAGHASSAAHSLSDRLAQGASSVGDLAKEYMSRLSMSSADAIALAREKLADGTANVRERLGDRAEQFRESAGETIGEIRHRANLALGREREHHYVAQTATALGSLALGAGLIWVFDPRLGRSRRTWLRDKSMHWLHETGDMFRYMGKHASNRLRGRVAETRGYFRRNEPVDDAKLCARVRTELGRVIEDPHAVEVVAQDGHVTLRGTADGLDINSIASVILGVRGVRGFDNQLHSPGMPATTTQFSPV